MKSLFTILTLLFVFLSANQSNAQSQKEKLVSALIKQINEYPGQTLGFSARNIYHVYNITIPAGAEVKETTSSYMTTVDITLTVSNGTYDITKEKIPYKLTVFKENKGSHAMARKNVGGIQILWTKKESTKEFSDQLKALKNLENTKFDELYSSEDSFPEEWKQVPSN